MIGATCQNCGGEVLLEVEFGLVDGMRLYAECQDCHDAGQMASEAFVSRAEMFTRGGEVGR